MTFPRPRKRRPRFNGAAADHAATELLAAITPAPEDGATYELGDEAEVAIDRIKAAGRAAWEQRPAAFGGANDVGVMVIATTQAAPLDGYQPEPASFPALQSVPEPRGILPPVPITEAAVIGDELRLPFVWCEMPRCISFHRDPASLGERDARDRAIADGWRHDAHGLLACPDCQQTRADYRSPLPVTWQHRAVPRQWHERGTVPTGQELETLTGAAEYARRINREDPALARDIIAATHRTAAS